jgi:hypothetical protein
MNAKRMINAVGGTRSAEWKSMPHTKDAKSAKKNSRFLFSLCELGVLERAGEGFERGTHGKLGTRNSQCGTKERSFFVVFVPFVVSHY